MKTHTWIPFALGLAVVLLGVASSGCDRERARSTEVAEAPAPAVATRTLPAVRVNKVPT